MISFFLGDGSLSVSGTVVIDRLYGIVFFMVQSFYEYHSATLQKSKIYI